MTQEIGLDPGEVQVVGRMRPTLSLHLLEVHPVVAIIPHDFVPNPNPEVRGAVMATEMNRIRRSINRSSHQSIQSNPFKSNPSRRSPPSSHCRSTSSSARRGARTAART